MYGSVQIKTAATVEPVSVEETKRFCRIDDDTDDDLISGLIISARSIIESQTSLALITQTFIWTMSEAPTVGFIPIAAEFDNETFNRLLDLPRSPVQSIGPITTTASDGTVTALVSGTDYVLNTVSDPGRVQFLNLPPISSLSHLSVEFVAGFGATGAAVPAALKTAIKMIVAHLYENRGDVGGEWPKAIEILVDPFDLKYV